MCVWGGGLATPSLTMIHKSYYHCEHQISAEASGRKIQLDGRHIGCDRLIRRWSFFFLRRIHSILPSRAHVLLELSSARPAVLKPAVLANDPDVRSQATSPATRLLCSSRPPGFRLRSNYES